MDAKLNHSDLIALLSESCALSLADAETFSTAFFELIVEGLESDGTVKINGLGTFKITSVESRESVDVNTGERIEIKGHKKLSFTPAESLKDTINAPFAIFEPVEVDSAIEDETEETVSDSNDNEEDVSEITIEPSPVSAEPVELHSAEAETDSRNNYFADIIEEEMPAEEQGEPLPASPLADVIEEEQPADEEVPQPVVTAKEPVGEVVKEPVVEASECEEMEPAKEETVADSENISEPDAAVSEPEQRNNGVFRKFVAVLAVAAVLSAAFWGYTIMQGDDSSGMIAQKEAVAIDNEPETPVAAKENAVSQDSAAVADAVAQSALDSAAIEYAVEEYSFVLSEALAARNISDITVKDTADYIITGAIDEHKVSLEETLIKISVKHYGDKRLWPYIVKYNNLSKPNDLACGMVLKIPRLVPRI